MLLNLQISDDIDEISIKIEEEDYYDDNLWLDQVSVQLTVMFWQKF